MTESEHLFFAKKLASNDLDLRTQTLRTLSDFFKSNTGLTKPELVKIWMGLWYAMWMSDKPTVQRDLAESLAKLVHSFKSTDDALLFIEVFYDTFHREFPKIDRLRYDKYLKMVRKVVHHTFVFLKNNSFDSELITRFIASQKKVWMLEDAQEIELHVCDLFYDELFLACGNNVPSSALMQFAGFFADLLGASKHRIVKQRLYQTLKNFISAATYCSPKLAPKRPTGMETNKEMFPDVEFVAVSIFDVEKWFMARASSREEFLNRDMMYDLHALAAKKTRADPGFSELPRGSIAQRMADVEEEEYERLMKKHKDSQAHEQKEEQVAKKISKGKQARQMRAEAKRKDMQEDEADTPQEEAKEVKEVHANGVAGSKKKGKKEKKQEGIVDITLPPPPPPPTAVKDVTAAADPTTTAAGSKKRSRSKNQKTDSSSSSSSSNPTPTLPTTTPTPTPTTSSTPHTKSTPTTPSTPSHTTTPPPQPSSSESTKRKRSNKNKQPASPSTSATTPAPPTPTPVSIPTPAPTPASIPTPVPAASTPKSEKKRGGSKVEKRKEPERDVMTTPTTLVNGKGLAKKRKVDATEEKVEKVEKVEKGKEAVKETQMNGKAKKSKGENATETPQKEATPKKKEATPVKDAQQGKKKKRTDHDESEGGGNIEIVIQQNGSGQKKKKEGREEKKKDGKEGKVTPQKKKGEEEMQTPLSGRKSVRFSKANSVKEFDKLQAVGNSSPSPAAASSPIKLKSLLTPPSQKTSERRTRSKK